MATLELPGPVLVGAAAVLLLCLVANRTGESSEGELAYAWSWALIAVSIVASFLLLLALAGWITRAWWRIAAKGATEVGTSEPVSPTLEAKPKRKKQKKEAHDTSQPAPARALGAACKVEEKVTPPHTLDPVTEGLKASVDSEASALLLMDEDSDSIALEFKRVELNRDQRPPSGWRWASRDDVLQHESAARREFGEWTVCTLSDGWKVKGPGYGFTIEKDLGDNPPPDALLTRGEETSQGVDERGQPSVEHEEGTVAALEPAESTPEPSPREVVTPAAEVALPPLTLDLRKKSVDDGEESTTCAQRAAPGANSCATDAVDGDGRRSRARGRSVDIGALDESPMHILTPRCQQRSSMRARSTSAQRGDEVPKRHSQVLGTSRKVRRESMGRVNDLSDVLERCELDIESCEDSLAVCEDQLRILRAAQEREEKCDASASNGESPAEGPVSLMKALPGLEAWKDDFKELQGRLETLIADALECSCNRDTFGAMDVFEAASANVESMAALLRRCRNAEEEVAAPLGCKAAEWRLTAASTLGPEELEALRSLLALARAETVVGRQARQPAALLRFLRAQEGRVPEALKMLIASLEWRRRYRIERRNRKWQDEQEENKTWMARLVARYKVHRVIGRDRFGLPVYLFRWGVFDIAGAERELGTEVVLRIILCIHEESLQEMRRSMFVGQALAPGGLSVWDLGNYGIQGEVPKWWSRMLSLVRFLPKVDEVLKTNYPEVVRRIMVIRTSTATRTLYQAALPFVPSKTLQKCKLYGWYASEWQADLREELTPESFDQLPAFLTRDDHWALAGAEPAGGLYPLGAALASREAAARSDHADSPAVRGRHVHRSVSELAAIAATAATAASSSPSESESEESSDEVAPPPSSPYECVARGVRCQSGIPPQS